MPSAYIIADIKINDMEKFKPYMAAAPGAVAAGGGEYIARGGKFEILEGNWQPGRLTVLKFESLDKARAFYNSEKYQAAKAQRAGVTEYFNMVVVEGL
jgi:uncharacterized protein (DUF1330 family)